MVVLVRAGAVVSLAVVAGCDGVFNSDPSIELPETGRLSVTGQARSTEFTGRVIGNDVDLGGTAGRGGASVLFETEDGEIIALTVNDDGVQIPFSTADGDFTTQDGLTVSFTSSDLEDFVFLFDPRSDEFDHQTFGVWQTNAISGSGRVGAGVFGTPTLLDGVPDGGSLRATFEGASTGWVEEGGVLGIAIGDLEAQTDFDTMDFVISGTQVVFFNGSSVPDARLDVSGELSVSRGGFTGPIAGTSSAIQGSVEGQFYGPTANEMGGTFAASDSSITYFGSFGAAR